MPDKMVVCDSCGAAAEGPTCPDKWHRLTLQVRWRGVGSLVGGGSYPAVMLCPACVLEREEYAKVLAKMVKGLKRK